VENGRQVTLGDASAARTARTKHKEPIRAGNDTYADSRKITKAVNVRPAQSILVDFQPFLRQQRSPSQRDAGVLSSSSRSFWVVAKTRELGNAFQGHNADSPAGLTPPLSQDNEGPFVGVFKHAFPNDNEGRARKSLGNRLAHR
jgi:hypothetical protein